MSQNKVIPSIIPNPASSTTTINFEAGNHEQIILVNTNTAASYSYDLIENADHLTIDVSNFPSGIYAVVLVRNGEVAGSLNLVVE